MHWDLVSYEVHVRPDVKDRGMGEREARLVEERELRLVGEVVEELLGPQKVVEGEERLENS
jgi:hypothetical protein